VVIVSLTHGGSKMFIILHNNCDSSDACSVIVPMGVDVRFPVKKMKGADQTIEPVVFATVDEAKLYITNELGWDLNEIKVPVLKEIEE